MVLRPFTVDSRQGYESSTVHTSDHKNSLPSGIEILNKIKQGITGTGTGTVHTSVRIQSKPIAYRLKAYPKKGGTFMERSLLNLQKNSKSQ